MNIIIEYISMFFIAVGTILESLVLIPIMLLLVVVEYIKHKVRRDK